LLGVFGENNAKVRRKSLAAAKAAALQRFMATQGVFNDYCYYSRRSSSVTTFVSLGAGKR
jgi:hypothetical protein